MYKLVISDDEGKQTTVPLVRDEITIGRKEGNTIRLTERNVSRRHARLQKQNGGYLLHDLGSYNGVVINGQRLADAQSLKNGDQILIGDYKLAIQEEATAQLQAPPPGSNGAHDTIEAPVSISAPPPPPAPVSAPPRTPPPPPPGPRAAVSGSAVPASNEGVPDEIRAMRLVFLSPASAPPPVTLDHLPLILGRSEVADISLPFSSISREHARLSLQGGVLVIEDLGSSNGVSVNGNKAPRHVIGPGDLVTLGVVEFRVARRGDSTVVMNVVGDRDEAKKKSPLGIVLALVGLGVVGGGVALAFRGNGTPASTTPPAATAPELGAQPATPAAPVAATPAPVAPTVAAPVPAAVAPPVAVAPPAPAPPAPAPAPAAVAPTAMNPEPVAPPPAPAPVAAAPRPWPRRSPTRG